jgi:hypothetical protein
VADAQASEDPLSFFNSNVDNYAAYLRSKPIDYFSRPYLSQICGQGIMFSVLDAIIPYPPAVKLRMYHAITSALAALVLTIILVWFYCEFGLFAGFSVLVFALCSQWLTVFGRNLWWSLWAFYLPMAMVMLYFLSSKKSRYSRYAGLVSIVFFSVLVKTFFNGYEYITTTLLMMLAPFVYYCFVDAVGLAAFFRGLVKAALSAGLAIAVSLCILCFQIATVSGNFSDGVKHLVYSLQKRTHAAPDDSTHPLLVETLKAPTLPVVLGYLQGDFCRLDLGVANSGSSGPRSKYALSYARLILFFAVMTVFLYPCGKTCAPGRRRSLGALSLAAWFSILAPLSWFVIFKAHSYSHGHLNFIVWQMPFVFFGAAISGLVVKISFSRLVAAVRGAPAGSLCS